MKKVIYRRTGAASEVLEIVERGLPSPGPGEVRVRVAWSGVNPSDTKSRAGTRSSLMPFPEVTPHSDGAGFVDAVGEGVDTARMGERVWLWNAAWGRPEGTAAEYVVLPQAQAVPLPASVPLEAGACLGIPAMTAAHAVLGYGGVRGQRVLVAGGAGAVGHYAVQMARLAGAAQVIATVSSEEKAAIAREAGAEWTVDYRTPDCIDRVRSLTGGQGVDRIIEVDLAANAKADFDMLASGGLAVVYGSGQPEASVPFVPGILKNLQLAFFIVYHLTPAARELAQSQLTTWLAEGRLQHRIAARLPLERIAEAHGLVEGGRTIGNVVVSVGDRA
jgi:NADPH:quinone reductase